MAPADRALQLLVNVILQALVHPSVSIALPSSQPSPASRTSLPQPVATSMTTDPGDAAAAVPAVQRPALPVAPVPAVLVMLTNVPVVAVVPPPPAGGDAAPSR